MKTKELKSLLEKMDYSVKRINGMIVIENKYGNVISTIEENTTFKFSTQHYAWNFISYSEQKIILSYIMGYAATPVDEREEEKKFYLEHRYFKCTNGDSRYFQIYESNGTPWLNAMYTVMGYKKQFTLKEIENMGEKFHTNFEDFELVEVEDE